MTRRSADRRWKIWPGACWAAEPAQKGFFMWLVFACLSAFFAGVTALLSKSGVRKTDSTLAMALRTLVVLLFAVAMVFAVGSQGEITSLSSQTWLFLVLSGLSTGASWLCYFKALQFGDVNKVVPIDKSSTALTIVLAIFFFGETDQLVVKLIGCTLIAVGTLLTVERQEVSTEARIGKWLPYALLSALFAALTSILGKIGIHGVESNLGTVIRTVVVLGMAWGIVALKAHGSILGQIRKIPRRDMVFIALSGVATGASWLCFFKALQGGPASVVVPIDKLSLLITVAFSALLFKEKLSRRAAVGITLITVGTLAMAIW